MTKHQPATPLPWRALPKQNGEFPIECAEGSRFVRLHYAHGVKAQHDAQRENAAYIAHAANAYPRLVEDIDGLLSYLETMAQHDRTSRAEHCRARIAASRALLRELGEV